MRNDRFILIIKFKKTDLCGSPRFSCFRRIFPHSIFVAQRFGAIFCEDCSACCRFAGRSFSITLIHTYGSFVGRIARHHAACRTVDTKPRRGILADDPVSDRFGRRRCLRPLRGCGKGGAVEFLGEVPFVRTERWGIGGFRYHWLCSLFRTLSQPLPVPENGTISLSRAQSSLLELSRREMDERNSTFFR